MPIPTIRLKTWEAGARYLRDLLLKYQNDPHQVTKALAAYNAGPGAVDKYKAFRRIAKPSSTKSRSQRPREKIATLTVAFR